MVTSVGVVDVRGPRFAAAVTCAVLVAALLTRATALLAFQVAVFTVTAAAGVRWSPYGNLFRFLRDRLGWGPPPAVEPASGPRFAQFLGGVFAGTGLAAVLAGAPLVGWGLVTVVALLAGLLAATGLCVGCEIHALAARLRAGRGTIVERLADEARGALNLPSDARTVLVFTSPACRPCVEARSVCDAVAAEREDVVVRTVDVSEETDLAREHGVLRAPTVLVAGADGSITGRLGGVPSPDSLTEAIDRSA